MKLVKTLALGALALAMSTGAAFADDASTTGTTPTTTTTTTTHVAPGQYCKAESKKHVKGEKGTAFSRCVTAMAKLDKGTADSPKAACAGLSKKHKHGEKGTAYSRCVSDGAKLLADKAS
jgi:hypothetical protein